MIIRFYTTVATFSLLLSCYNSNAMNNENGPITIKKTPLVKLTLKCKDPEDKILQELNDGQRIFDREGLRHKYIYYGNKPGFMVVQETGKYERLLHYLRTTPPYSTWIKDASLERLRMIIFPDYKADLEQLKVKLQALKSTPEQLQKRHSKTWTSEQPNKVIIIESQP